ncbi:Uncharacterised protein [Mycobacteroides abscessus]|nr:Uncharacterised protein [Mycobacteroides abscessus]
MSLEAVFMNSIGPIIVNRHWQEVILDVWPFKLIRRTDKATRFKLVAGTNAFTQE